MAKFKILKTQKGLRSDQLELLNLYEFESSTLDYGIAWVCPSAPLMLNTITEGQDKILHAELNGHYAKKCRFTLINGEIEITIKEK